MAPKKLSEEKMKEALKEGLKEWLDQQYSTIGRWTIRTFAALILSALVYFIVWMNGTKFTQ